MQIIMDQILDCETLSIHLSLSRGDKIMAEMDKVRICSSCIRFHNLDSRILPIDSQ
jgi:hypothetical protein